MDIPLRPRTSTRAQKLLRNFGRVQSDGRLRAIGNASGQGKDLVWKIVSNQISRRIS